MQAVQKVGGPFGSAILGSVLISAYQGQIHVAGLPAAAAGTVRKSVFGGLAVAHQLGSASLLAAVRAAFVHGMDAALAASAGIAVAGIILSVAFLPWRTRSKTTPTEPMKEERPLVVAR
jgi:hypothetical protein